MSFLCLDYDKEKTFCPIVQLSNQGGKTKNNHEIFVSLGYFPYFCTRKE